MGENSILHKHPERCLTPHPKNIACISLLQFPLPQTVPWRINLLDAASKSCEEMLNDIVWFQDLWNNTKNSLSTKTIDNALKQMDFTYIHNINIQEGTGTHQKEATFEILNGIWNDEDNRIPHIKKSSPSKNITETTNLYKALKRLRKITNTEKILDPRNLGFLEIDSFIKEIHTIVMTGAIGDKLTPPGVFSTKPRRTTYKGSLHEYPIRTEVEWELEIQNLIDRYNGLIQRIKSEYLFTETRKKAVLDLFKCTAFFTFNLLSLHPFSDGNGRISHLLAGYILATFTPFYNTIYNIYSEHQNGVYTDAIINAREGTGHPEQLTALFIESNWMSWRIFLKQLRLLPSSTSKHDAFPQTFENLTIPDLLTTPQEQVSTSHQ